MTSVKQAIQQLSEVTGWLFLDDRGQLITPERQNSGVDTVVATTSASEPLRLVLAGIMRDVSLRVPGMRSVCPAPWLMGWCRWMDATLRS